MAITTLDGALAGMKYPREIVKAVTGTMVAGRPHTIWYQGGIPSAGHASSAGLVGEILTTGEAGQIPFTNPVSGNSYLERLALIVELLSPALQNRYLPVHYRYPQEMLMEQLMVTEYMRQLRFLQQREREYLR
jgi:hypothetical protein